MKQGYSCVGISAASVSTDNSDHSFLLEGGSAYLSHYSDKAGFMNLLQAEVSGICYCDDCSKTADASAYVKSDVIPSGVNLRKYQPVSVVWGETVSAVRSILSRQPPISFTCAGILLAHVNSKRSKCTKFHVGAVAFNKDQGVLGMGYNGPARDTENCNEVGCNKEKGGRCRGCHAEQNCCVNTSSTKLLAGGTFFTTVFPCLDCASRLAHNQVERIYFWEPYRKQPSDGVNKKDEFPDVFRLARETGMEFWQYTETGFRLVAGPDTQNSVFLQT